MFCSNCGKELSRNQTVCHACGTSLDRASTDGWSTGVYVALLVLSFFIPLFGLIYGGLQIKKAAEGSQRKRRAWHFVIAGIVGAIIAMGQGGQGWYYAGPGGWMSSDGKCIGYTTPGGESYLSGC